jgi:hypothetical protein
MQDKLEVRQEPKIDFPVQPPSKLANSGYRPVTMLDQIPALIYENSRLEFFLASNRILDADRIDTLYSVISVDEWTMRSMKEVV